MADVKELMVPWLKDLKPYFSEHIEKAWEDKALIRMMSNEGPFSPQKAVLNALSEGIRKRSPMLVSSFLA